MLRKVIENLRRERGITFEGDLLTTENMYSIGSLIFLRNLHSCCEVSNDRWRAVIWAFTEHQIKRYDKGEISHDTYQEHSLYADQCVAQMLADCEAKNQREKRSEYYNIFGVNDDK